MHVMLNTTFSVKTLKEEQGYAMFVIGPLSPGYGYTLGHAMRRALLTSIPGAAITSVRINGVKHKFSEAPGLKENIVDFLLNLKGVAVKLSGSKKTATLSLSVKGPHTITAGDIEVSEGVTIANPDHYLGHLSDKKLDVEMTVEEGYGYSLSEDREISEVGTIPTDAVFTPVQRVNYTVKATRVGRQTDLDELTMEIWTNGAVTPHEALMQSAKLLSGAFSQIYLPEGETYVATAESSTVSNVASDSPSLRLTIDELDLPTRIYNSLRNGGIETIGQLIERPRKELVSMRNMGSKSITIIEEKLKEKGVTLSN
jgi:DNA-directed RNA polymerase subunit alpha